MDTVEANEALGLPVENRRYEFVPGVLALFGVASIVLLTNNPFKVHALRRLGVNVVSRLPIVAQTPGDHAASYLRTKVEKMGHVIPEPPVAQVAPSAMPLRTSHTASPPVDALSARDGSGVERLLQWLEADLQGAAWKTRLSEALERPSVTLAFAQSLDGSIAPAECHEPTERLLLSGRKAQRATHAVRAAHDAILVGVGTVLADDPRLTTRLVQGGDALPIILDTNGRTPRYSRLVRQAEAKYASHGGGVHLVVFVAASTSSDLGKGAAASGCKDTTDVVRRSRHPSNLAHRLNSLPGVAVEYVPYDANGCETELCLSTVLARLHDSYACRSVMVEGGARVLAAFLRHPSCLFDRVVCTIAPVFVGGRSYASSRAVEHHAHKSHVSIAAGIEPEGVIMLDRDVVVFGKMQRALDTQPVLGSVSYGKAHSTINDAGAQWCYAAPAFSAPHERRPSRHVAPEAASWKRECESLKPRMEEALNKQLLRPPDSAPDSSKAPALPPSETGRNPRNPVPASGRLDTVDSRIQNKTVQMYPSRLRSML